MRVPKIGEYVKVNGIPSLKDVEVKVVAAAFDSVWVKKKHSREDVEVPLDLVEFIGPELFDGKEKKELIKKWVLADQIPTYKEMMRELNFFGQLFDLFPNKKFWMQFEPDFQVKSLSWWIGGGREEIRKHYNLYTLDFTSEKEQNHIQSNKIGEDLKIYRKPNNVFDIL